MPDGSEAYYDQLFGTEAGASIGKNPTGIKEMMKGGLNNPMLKSAGMGIFGTWLLQKILQTKHESGMRDIQREGLRSQAEMITPENIYMQAAQPAAQEEESMARMAFMQQLSGGVIGPSLAKGEYQIGG